MKPNSTILTVREAGAVRAEFQPSGRSALVLGPDAVAEYLVLQDGSAEEALEAAFDITLEAGASLRMTFLTLQGTQIHNDIHVALIGAHAECNLGGLYLPDGDAKVTFDVLMEHLVPECRSTQLFKGVVDGRAVARFNGLIKVVPDAQKTEAYQANHNLLLSEAAKAFTQPQLEIYADDVKCSHGATVGRLNEEELFYMRTRGIGEQEARLLLQMAFAGEVVEMISSQELRDEMLSRVEARLRG